MIKPILFFVSSYIILNLLPYMRNIKKQNLAQSSSNLREYIDKYLERFDINECDGNFDTLLDHTYYARDVDLFDYLLSKKADILQTKLFNHTIKYRKNYYFLQPDDEYKYDKILLEYIKILAKYNFFIDTSYFIRDSNCFDVADIPLKNLVDKFYAEIILYVFYDPSLVLDNTYFKEFLESEYCEPNLAKIIYNYI